MKQQHTNPGTGIRPIIDGRPGSIRESLEGPTMQMRKNGAVFFSVMLKYPDGSRQQCVIADGCIGGIKEAGDCRQKFESYNVGLSISVTPCWCYGIGAVLQIAEGYTIDIPERVHIILNERTDKTWLTTWFVTKITGTGSFRDFYNVMANWGANLGSACYGHTGHQLITLAFMPHIPVNMHNVAEEKIFRSPAWKFFYSHHDASKN